MDKLNFSYNWNNKLDCKAFTTIRLANSYRYQVGKQFEITLNDQPKGTGVIKAVKRFQLKDLNEFIAFLDTGYNVDNAKDVIIRMYPKVDFRTANLYFILLVKEKE